MNHEVWSAFVQYKCIDASFQLDNKYELNAVGLVLRSVIFKSWKDFNKRRYSKIPTFHTSQLGGVCLWIFLKISTDSNNCVERYTDKLAWPAIRKASCLYNSSDAVGCCYTDSQAVHIPWACSSVQNVHSVHSVTYNKFGTLFVIQSIALTQLYFRLQDDEFLCFICFKHSTRLDWWLYQRSWF